MDKGGEERAKAWIKRWAESKENLFDWFDRELTDAEKRGELRAYEIVVEFVQGFADVQTVDEISQHVGQAVRECVSEIRALAAEGRDEDT